VRDVVLRSCRFASSCAHLPAWLAAAQIPPSRTLQQMCVCGVAWRGVGLDESGSDVASGVACFQCALAHLPFFASAAAAGFARGVPPILLGARLCRDVAAPARDWRHDCVAHCHRSARRQTRRRVVRVARAHPRRCFTHARLSTDAVPIPYTPRPPPLPHYVESFSFARTKLKTLVDVNALGRYTGDAPLSSILKPDALPRLFRSLSSTLERYVQDVAARFDGRKVEQVYVLVAAEGLTLDGGDTGVDALNLEARRLASGRLGFSQSNIATASALAAVVEAAARANVAVIVGPNLCAFPLGPAYKCVVTCAAMRARALTHTHTHTHIRARARIPNVGHLSLNKKNWSRSASSSRRLVAVSTSLSGMRSRTSPRSILYAPLRLRSATPRTSCPSPLRASCTQMVCRTRRSS
jgi:hypothetical protein